MAGTTELTYGQKLVGVSVDPAADPVVEGVKQTFADLIDDMKDRADNSRETAEFSMDLLAIDDLVRASQSVVRAMTWEVVE